MNLCAEVAPHRHTKTHKSERTAIINAEHGYTQQRVSEEQRIKTDGTLSGAQKRSNAKCARTHSTPTNPGRYPLPHEKQRSNQCDSKTAQPNNHKTSKSRAIVTQASRLVHHSRCSGKVGSRRQNQATEGKKPIIDAKKEGRERGQNSKDPGT